MKRPFFCGTQYLDWKARNCERCAKWDAEKAGSCEIDSAIGAALFGNGTFTDETAARMGYTDCRALTWDCPERIGPGPIGPGPQAAAVTSEP